MKFETSEVCFSYTLDTVNKEDGIIKGVTIAREGIAKGHGVFLDANFISDLVEMGNKKEKGVKSRFGHPNPYSDALGTYLGRFKNFRVSDKKAIADLYLDESAKISPHGNLYDYVLSMASDNPDMFGNSIVFKAGESDYRQELNEAGEVIEKEYVSIVDLTASDLVDTPAATDSLFSTNFYLSKQTHSDYPQAAVNNAKRGIKLNEKVNNKCATDVGKQRAQQIAKKEALSMSTIKRTFSYLSRAEEYYDPKDPEACGTISYLLWGGKPMKAWCERKIKQLENNYEIKKEGMEKSFMTSLKEGLVSLGLLKEESSEVVETEEVVTEETVAEVEAVEEEVVEETVSEDLELSAEEVEEAEAHVEDIVAETEIEKEAEFAAKEEELRTEFSTVLKEKEDQIAALRADIEAKELELSEAKVEPTVIEGSSDPEIGESKKLSESAQVIADFLKQVRG